MLAEGLRLSGEGKVYFMSGRLDCMFRNLPPGWRPRRVLDFGCGIGDTAAALAARLPGADVLGVDLARPALAHARGAHPTASFAHLDELPGLPPFDLCYVNGVFHHIDPSRRGEALATIHRALRPGGYLALFENNAWNPGARMVMRRIPFDREATPMRPGEARKLVTAAGFGPRVTVRSLFYFPRPLARLRPLERPLATLPLGAQFMVLAAAGEAAVAAAGA